MVHCTSKTTLPQTPPHPDLVASNDIMITSSHYIMYYDHTNFVFLHRYVMVPKYREGITNYSGKRKITSFHFPLPPALHTCQGEKEACWKWGGGSRCSPPHLRDWNWLAVSLSVVPPDQWHVQAIRTHSWIDRIQ